ncbi:MAG: hypothetical protein KDD27_13940, partial [Saprospiraceae bacterium]|nr:hypothetical protein [Saprospiraceae bacterium]
TVSENQRHIVPTERKTSVHGKLQRFRPAGTPGSVYKKLIFGGSNRHFCEQTTGQQFSQALIAIAELPAK